MTHRVTLQWAGGEHEFALGIGQLRALQTSCDAGPEEVLNRLRFGTWLVDDVIEPIRLGLIGSGAMNQKEAGPFVLRLFEQHEAVQFKLTALNIMARAMFGVDDDPVGESEGEAPPLESGASQGSTEPEQ